MRNKNQLKVDIDHLRYSADTAELRNRLCKILKNLTDGTQEADTALSTTSENAVQNKVITEELNRLQEEIDGIETPTMREFEIDDVTGHLMLTEVGRADSTSFELDENGHFNVIVE